MATDCNTLISVEDQQKGKLNADTFTEFIETENNSIVTPEGKTKRSLSGGNQLIDDALTQFNQDAATAIANSGYDFSLGLFASGILVSNANQALNFEGNWYIPDAAVPLTTDGATPALDSRDWLAVSLQPLQQVARSLNIVDSDIILDTDTVTPIPAYIYAPSQQKTYLVPPLARGLLISTVIDSTLTTSLALVFELADSSVKPLTILSTGQSNMVGVSQLLQGDTTPNNFCRAWDGDILTAGSSYIKAELGAIPFNVTGNQHIGFNACKHLAENYGIPTDLINIARSSTLIERWLFDSPTPTCWDAIEQECAAAYALTGNTVDIVLWHQGESDDLGDILYYVTSFKQFAQQVKDAVWSSEDVKFIIGGLAPGQRPTGTTGVRPQMNLALSMIAERLSDVTGVYTGDLLTDSTDLHFLDNSIIEIGKRFAEAVLSNATAVLQPTRYVEGNTSLIYSEGVDGFINFGALINFLTTLVFKNDSRLLVTLPAGSYEVFELRLGLLNAAITFKGELDGGFTQPVKADFSGVAATDLTMLQGKYLTQLNLTDQSSFLIANGSSCGQWEDALVTHISPAAGAVFVRNSDIRGNGGGAISLSNVAFHGALDVALLVDDGCTFRTIDCTFSHCAGGVAEVDMATIAMKDDLGAYCGSATSATNRGFISAAGLQLTGESGTSYTARLGSYIDARTADDNTNIINVTNGIVEN